MQHGKKLFRNLLAKLMVCTLIISSILISPGTLAKAAVKEPAISKSVDILVGEKYSLNVSNKVKNSTYKWTSSNKQVATVTSKGLVTGIKKGTTDITCTVKTPKVTYYLLSKVTVRDSATAIKINNKVTVLNLGQKYDLNRTLTPATSNDKTVWSSSNTKIAKPDSLGKIKALKVGEVKITAKTLSGKTDSVMIKVVDKTGTVTNQEELNALLSSGASMITLQTADAVNINIPEGNYQKQNLVVDAPNADIVNQGTFKSVDILQIKASTWYEQAVGNILNVSAPNARVVVEEVASASIHVNNSATNLNLVNNGTVNELQVNAAASVNISGSSTTPIPVSANYSGATITSSIPLILTCTQRINLVILPGAEATTIQVESEDLIPVITGSSSVRVIVGTGETARTVVVEPTVNTGSGQNSSSGGSSSHNNNPSNPGNPEEPENPGNPEEPENPGTPVGASISGRVTVVTGSSVELEDGSVVVSGGAVTTEALPGVNVRILKYDGSVSDALDSIFTNPNTILSCTDGEGYYMVDNLEQGNYIVVFAKQDYKVLVQLTTVAENSPSIVNGSLIKLEHGEELWDGSASGNIIDALTGEPVDEELEFTLEIYKDFNNTTELVTTEVVSGAAFSFWLPEGYYTVKLTDNREPVYGVTYTATTRNVIVLGGTTFTDQDVVMATLKEEGQASFVLTWGEYPYDLDSHLIGPVEGNDNYHIYYGNKTYPEGIEEIENLHLRLDVDDVTSYGPETTSIYKPVEGGIYTYYVYNFSGNGGGTLVNSGAKVVVTTSEGTYTFEAPAGGDELSWVVCTYNSATGEITPINRLVAGDYYAAYMEQLYNQ